MAYNRYQDQEDELLQKYNLLAGEEADVYARQYQEEQGAVADHQYNTSFGYQAYRDQVSDSQWQQSFDYQKEQDQISNELAQKNYDLSYSNYLRDASKASQQAAQESVLEKPIYSHIDDDTGLYHYYMDGKEVKYEQGVNPVTGTVNPDVEDGVFLDKNGNPGYQPNNIGGVPIEKTGVTDYINGYEQNVWRKTDDGSWWMWDDTKNAYVPHSATDNINSDNYKDVNSNFAPLKNRTFFKE